MSTLGDGPSVPLKTPQRSEIKSMTEISRTPVPTQLSEKSPYRKGSFHRTRKEGEVVSLTKVDQDPGLDKRLVIDGSTLRIEYDLW